MSVGEDVRVGRVRVYTDKREGGSNVGRMESGSQGGRSSSAIQEYKWKEQAYMYCTCCTAVGEGVLHAKLEFPLFFRIFALPFIA